MPWYWFGKKVIKVKYLSSQKLVILTIEDPTPRHYSQILVGWDDWNNNRQKQPMPATPHAYTNTGSNPRSGVGFSTIYFDEASSIHDAFYYETNRKEYKIKSMTLADYFELLTFRPSALHDVVEGILEAQARGVDFSALWLSETMDINKPFMIKIGEDIPISFLYNKAEIKWLPNTQSVWTSSWRNLRPDTHLRKDQAFIIDLSKRYKGQFTLFQFPVQANQQAPILPKTDYYLYIEGTCPAYEVEERIYCAYGVEIMKKFSSGNALTLLATRIKLIEQSPTATNTILAMQIMEAILLDKAKEGKLDSFLEGPGEKTLDRFEKLKALALSNDNFQERKLAVTRCYQTFQKLIGE